ncbi:hypothetical protein, partial [Burkholderia pseudomallei]|uniref:hypothetical protein n=1 Tax=Burkholderia pseudomallei TaxID=28450 RepID=UPI001C8038E6
AIPPPDIHKIRRQVTQSFSKAPRFSAMNQKKRRCASSASPFSRRPPFALGAPVIRAGVRSSAS